MNESERPATSVHPDNVAALARQVEQDVRESNLCDDDAMPYVFGEDATDEQKAAEERLVQWVIACAAQAAQAAVEERVDAYLREADAVSQAREAQLLGVLGRALLDFEMINGLPSEIYAGHPFTEAVTDLQAALKSASPTAQQLAAIVAAAIRIATRYHHGPSSAEVDWKDLGALRDALRNSPWAGIGTAEQEEQP